MPFGSYTQENDGVVARLGIEVPDNMDETLTKITNTVDSLKTSLESTNRFTKDFVNYLKKIPEIQRTVDEFQRAQIGYLKETAEYEERITAAQKGREGLDLRNPAPATAFPSREPALQPTLYDQQRRQGELFNQHQMNQMGMGNPLGFPFGQHHMGMTGTMPFGQHGAMFGSPYMHPGMMSGGMYGLPGQYGGYPHPGMVNPLGVPVMGPTIPFPGPVLPTHHVQQQQKRERGDIHWADNTYVLPSSGWTRFEDPLGPYKGPRVTYEGSIEYRDPSSQGGFPHEIHHPRLPTPDEAPRHLKKLSEEHYSQFPLPSDFGHKKPSEPTQSPSERDQQQESQNRSLRYTDRLQSILDHRKRLEKEISSPEMLLERLQQRGLVSEGIHKGRVQHNVSIGGRNYTADEFLQNKDLQERGLDILAEKTGPNSDENGTFGRRTRAISEGMRTAMSVARPGGDVPGGLKNIGSYLQSLGKGGSGGVLGGLVEGGAVVGGVAALLEGVNEVGQNYQSVKNEGLIHGGGAGAGLGYEAQIRMMAMSPFLTNEQSRQIINGALQSGFTGKEFDNVADFMAENLKASNLQISDSFKLLKSNVEQGGQSIQSLGAQIGTLTQTAQGGSKTLPQMQQQFSQGSQQLVDMGIGGQQAGQYMLTASNIYNRPLENGQPNPLVDVGTQAYMDTLSNPVMQAQLASETPGLAPPMAASKLSETPGLLGKSQTAVFKRYAQQASNAGGNAPYVFQQLMRSNGANLTLTQAKQFYDDLMSGKDPFTEAQNQVNQNTGNVNVSNPQRGFVSNTFAGASIMWGGIEDIWGSLTGLTTTNHAQRATDDMSMNAASTTNQALKNVVDQYGSENLIVYDEKGQPHKIDFNDKNMLNNLQSGKWKVATATGRESTLLSQNWNKEAGALKGGAVSLTDLAQGAMTDKTGQGSGVTANVKIDLSDQAKLLIKALPNQGTVPTDSNTLNSLSGYGGATPNNPAPGNGG